MSEGSLFEGTTNPGNIGAVNVPEYKKVLRDKQQIFRCVSGSDHLVLVDTDGRAWSAGHGPQTGLVHEVRTSTPNKSDFGGLDNQGSGCEAQIAVTRIDFFQGVKIIAIDSGKDFNVALVKKIISLKN